MTKISHLFILIIRNKIKKSLVVWLVFIVIICSTMITSVPNTTDVVNSNLDQGEVYNIISSSCLWLVTGRWFSPGIPVSSINKTDCHDITEILLKVALKQKKNKQRLPDLLGWKDQTDMANWPVKLLLWVGVMKPDHKQSKYWNHVCGVRIVASSQWLNHSDTLW